MSLTRAMRTNSMWSSLLRRSRFSSRMSARTSGWPAPPTVADRLRVAGEHLMSLAEEPVPPDVAEVHTLEGGHEFVWVPERHVFAGTERNACSRRVADPEGFEGTCGYKYSSPVHIDSEHASKLAEETLSELGDSGRAAGSAEPGDHVGHRELEDFLVGTGKLERIEAQRLAHMITVRYDLFPKGLLLIHPGLDNMPAATKGTKLR